MEEERNVPLNPKKGTRNKEQGASVPLQNQSRLLPPQDVRKDGQMVVFNRKQLRLQRVFKAKTFFWRTASRKSATLPAMGRSLEMNPSMKLWTAPVRSTSWVYFPMSLESYAVSPMQNKTFRCTFIFVMAWRSFFGYASKFGDKFTPRFCREVQDVGLCQLHWSSGCLKWIAWANCSHEMSRLVTTFSMHGKRWLYSSKMFSFFDNNYSAKLLQSVQLAICCHVHHISPWPDAS